MRTKIAVLLMVLGFAGGCAHAPTFTSEPVRQADIVVWVGLDYSQVRLIGTEDFRKPEEIFPRMPEKWNNIQVAYGTNVLRKHLKKKIISDIEGMAERNQSIKPNQIIRKDGTKEEMVDASHLNADAIAAEVKTIKLKEAEGMGLVFIIDRLVKKQDTLCLYAVFFDIKTREVLESKRFCETGRGIGFFNYWGYPLIVALEKVRL